jgi:hypothetical protein
VCTLPAAVLQLQTSLRSSCSMSITAMKQQYTHTARIRQSRDCIPGRIDRSVMLLKAFHLVSQCNVQLTIHASSAATAAAAAAAAAATISAATANEINGVRLSRKGKGVPPPSYSPEQETEDRELLPRRGKGYVRPSSEELVARRQLGSAAPVSSSAAPTVHMFVQ